MIWLCNEVFRSFSFSSSSSSTYMCSKDVVPLLFTKDKETKQNKTEILNKIFLAFNVIFLNFRQDTVKFSKKQQQQQQLLLLAEQIALIYFEKNELSVKDVQANIVVWRRDRLGLLLVHSEHDPEQNRVLHCAVARSNKQMSLFWLYILDVRGHDDEFRWFHAQSGLFVCVHGPGVQLSETR